MNKRNGVISLKELVRGFGVAIENAIELLSAATKLEQDYPSKALALAQIGQEEIGKSLTILAAFGLPFDDALAWEWFWKGWRNHVLKAHRAYLYELISPLRLTVFRPDGKLYDGLPLHEPISREKEIGLYVDYDAESKVFTSPNEEVSAFDGWARISTLMYLAATADAVNRALSHTKSEFRFQEFGSLAFLLCTKEVYQQDMPCIFETFAGRSAEHARMMKDLNVALEAPKKMFEDIIEMQKQKKTKVQKMKKK